MNCCVEGCDREADYKADKLCQKHYFRRRRNGGFHVRTAKPRIEDHKGYQYLHRPGHPLAAKGQIYVSEQRVVLYEALGPGPMSCALCGCGLTWKTCQADHIDENPRNNERSNLRPLCRPCNVWRNMPPAFERVRNAVVLTYDGETKTAHEWSRDARVSIAGKTIRNRKRAGMSDFECLFGAKKTHNGNHSARYVAKRKELEKNQ